MKQQGFSLIETLIAVSVFAIVLAGIVPLFTYNASINLLSQRRSDAIALAQSLMEDLRGQDSSQWPQTPDGGTSTETVNGTNYMVTRTYSNVNDARKAKIDVSFNGKVLFSLESIYTQITTAQ